MNRFIILHALAMALALWPRAAVLATEPSPSASVAEPTGAITLAQALAVVLVASPELAEFWWQLRASEARGLQAGLRPNPEASVQVEDVLGTGRFSAAS
ncbi:MAG: hypothetical protein ACREQ9_05580 [Candidatus Binatia bacterium]